VSGPTINKVVADFTAESTGDKNVRLKDLRGKNVVIYFYPKDSTPGCTLEGHPFDLLSDPDGKLCGKFDVIREKNMYGRKFMGIERSTFLIDVDGKLRREWRKVKVKGHAEEVLAAVKDLGQ
jgi:peroxiredoxin Q/BCP